MNLKTMKRLTILKGEGSNQHTLYGNFDTVETVVDYQEFKVKQSTLLKHERPDGSFSQEHKTLSVSEGTWVMGKQVEWNPFSATIIDVWD